MSLPTGFGGPSGGPGKATNLSLAQTFSLALQDPDLRSRISFVLFVFAVFAFGVHVPVPIPGVKAQDLQNVLQGGVFDLLNMFGGGALRRLSIFALGLNPYITAQIIIQILTTAYPQWKQELQEGGEYARQQQNKRTRALTLFLCLIQGWALIGTIGSAAPAVFGSLPLTAKLIILLFWTTGAIFMLWLGEQISERGIGNGVSLMIFAGIILALPYSGQRIYQGFKDGVVAWWSIVLVLLFFVAATWFIVYFTTAQRRIPVQHMKRAVGTRMTGGQTSYLPLSVNMAGVLPIIFAVSLVTLPYQFGLVFGGDRTPIGRVFTLMGEWLNPGAPHLLEAVVGSILYTALIFFFTYFWTAIQYSVEDISNNLKRGGSFIPGVRPGKQTKDFLDGVISRITVVGATFIAIVALLQYIAPKISGINAMYVNVLGGTSLLIMVQVALETMRQIEANLLMKHYGQ